MTEPKKFIPIEDNKLYFLFRRGKEEHIQALYNEGEIYINTIDYIRKCDNNNERSDIYDSIMYRDYWDEAKITMCDIGKDFNKDGTIFDTINTVLYKDTAKKGNIYCLTGIYSDHLLGNRNNITFETKSFGEAIIFIHNPKAFLDRIFKVLKENSFINFKANKVFYYKNDYSGDVGFFNKHERFKPQSEYRIFVPNSKNVVIKLKIGALKDIATINNNFIELSYTDDMKQLIKFL